MNGRLDRSGGSSLGGRNCSGMKRASNELQVDKVRTVWFAIDQLMAMDT